MLNLNRIANNGADKIVGKYAQKALDEFKKDLVGVVMGVAYGGDLEDIGKMWKDKGTVYGFDTFAGHPKQLVADRNSFEATCMDFWYQQFGIYFLSAESIRQELNDLGLTNTVLVRGLVNKESCKDIPYINFAFIDLDIAVAMADGFESVKDKIVKGGYLLLHDVIPEGHIPATNKWYRNVVLTNKNFRLLDEITPSYVAVLQRI